MAATNRFLPPNENRSALQLGIFRVLVIAEFNPDREQLAQIDERLSYLDPAVDRLNRFDWKAVALSTLIGMATNLTLDTERGRILWGLFQQAMTAVGHMLH